MKGLRARGGFIIDESWERGRLLQATIRSTIGGVIRLRSYVPLKGKHLRQAAADCPNPLLKGAEIKEPLKSPELKAAQQPIPQRKVYEYDLQTQPGHLYTVKSVAL